MTNKHLYSLVHRTSGIIAFILLLLFWISTAVSELSGIESWIILVKTTIPYGFIILIPALILTGITGMMMAGKSKNPLIVTKKKRMPFIAINGIFILIPCAIILCYLAQKQQFGSLFISIQSVELIIGALNITLIFLNIRTGMQLAHTVKKSPI